MTKFILILLIALVFEAIGVAFLSGGLNQIGEPKTINATEIMLLIKRGATNKNISNRRFLRSYFLRLPALHAFTKGRQHRLAVDGSWFHYHEPGSQDFSQRRDIECSLGGDLSDRVRCGPGYMERKGEGERAKGTTASFNRLPRPMTAVLSSTLKFLPSSGLAHHRGGRLPLKLTAPEQCAFAFR